MNRLVVAMLRWYREFSALRPPACRFAPSCSAYTLTAVELHGTVRGLYLGVRRILRCHPLGGHGYDPVPGSAHQFERDAPRAAERQGTRDGTGDDRRRRFADFPKTNDLRHHHA